MTDVGPLTFAGFALVVAYWLWLWAFFTHVRPRVMARLGRRLRVAVRESEGVADAGTYEVDDVSAPVGKRAAVLAADLGLILVGVIGVAALIFVPAFLAAESGVLLPLEGSITGRSARLVAAMADMPAPARRVETTVTVHNSGRRTLAACAVVTKRYSARTGYVDGRTAAFTLAAGETRALALVLDSQRPVTGEHRIPLELECENRRIAAGSVLLTVR